MRKILVIAILVLTLLCGAFVGCDNNDEIPQTGQNSYSATEYDIVKNNASEYKIVIGSTATETEKYAAGELQLFLNKSTNVSLPIKTDTEVGSDAQKCISVGKTTLRENHSDLEESIQALDQGGVRIKTISDNVFVTGRTNQGTLNAVYQFLYYHIGFKAYSQDCVKYDYFTTLKLLDIDLKYDPSIDYVVTNSYEVYGLDKLQGASRMYTQGYNGVGGFNQDGHLYELWCHTTEIILPYDSYGSTHKDWYGNGQLCFSNEEMLEEFAYVLFSGYISTTNCPFIMIGSADTKSCCTCDDCNDNAKLYGGQSGIFTRFLNKVSDKIEEYLEIYNIDKEIMIVGLNYYYYAAAPVIDNGDGTYSPIHESVVPDATGKVTVGVCYAPISACYTHAFGDENCMTNAGSYKDLMGWASLTDNLFMYTYGTSYATNDARNFHYNNWSFMAEQFKLYDKLKLDYLFDETGGTSPLVDMRTFVRSSLGWNANVNVQDLINEFMDVYYGIGAKYVKEYFDSAMEHFEYIYTKNDTECQGTFYDNTSASNWPLAIWRNWQNILMNGINEINQNKTLSEQEKQIYADRIYKEFLFLKVNEYELYSAYYSTDELIEAQKYLQEAQSRFNIKV